VVLVDAVLLVVVVVVVVVPPLLVLVLSLRTCYFECKILLFIVILFNSYVAGFAYQ